VIRIAEKNVNNRIESLITNFRSEAQGLKKIGLPTAEGLVFEEIENIIHLQAESNYTLVFIRNKKKMTITKSLKEFEDILPANTFCRLHHSHIVNLNYITKYYKGRGGYVELSDGTTVEVSTRKKDDFLEKFKI
jgi:two-component system LytT family response regulator